MNGIDLAILICVIVCVGLGAYWGLIRQVLALVGLVAGIVLAGRYGGAVGDALTSVVDSLPLAQLLGYIVVMIVVTTVASLAATLIRRFVGLLFLGWLDHALGAVLGFAQASLFSAAFLFTALVFPNSLWTPAIRESQVATSLVAAYRGLFEQLLPGLDMTSVTAMLGLG